MSYHTKGKTYTTERLYRLYCDRAHYTPDRGKLRFALCICFEWKRDVHIKRSETNARREKCACITITFPTSAAIVSRYEKSLIYIPFKRLLFCDEHRDIAISYTDSEAH